MAPVIGSKERVKIWRLVLSKLDANSCKGSVSRPHQQHEGERELIIAKSKADIEPIACNQHE